LLKDHLNASLNAQSGWTPADPSEDKVVFIDGEVADPMAFKLGAVSLLLVNLEEEKMLPAARPLPENRRHRRRPAGPARHVPAEARHDLRRNLYAPFVARFKQYE
jgi:hypothetical protein